MDGDHLRGCEGIGRDRFASRVKREIEKERFGAGNVAFGIADVIAVFHEIVIGNFPDARNDVVVDIYHARRPDGGDVQRELPAVAEQKPVERFRVLGERLGEGVGTEQNKNICAALRFLMPVAERYGRTRNFDVGQKKFIGRIVCRRDRGAGCEVENGDRGKLAAVRSRHVLGKRGVRHAAHPEPQAQPEGKRKKRSQQNGEKTDQVRLIQGISSAGKE